MNKIYFIILTIFIAIGLFFSLRNEDILAPKIVKESISKKNYNIEVSKIENGSLKYREVSDFIDYSVNDFQSQHEDFIDPDGRKYDLFIDTTVATSSQFLSFVVQVYRYTGGAHGSNVVKTFIYKDDRLVDEKYIFKDSEWRVLISKKARDYFKKELGSYLDISMLEDGTMPDYRNFNDFYISGDSIIFVFQEYSIGPYALGIQEMKIKLKDISNILKSNIQTASVSNVFLNDYRVEDPKDNRFEVVGVSDGDTISVKDISGNIFKVRLLGVNTPETVDPRKKVECFGKEASDFLKKNLYSKKVHLVSDESQGDFDKYKRLLRYVYLDDILINKVIIEQGYGYEYTYRLPYKFQKEFKEAQKEAEKNKLGLWADGVCESR